jgi:hypothetical protein
MSYKRPTKDMAVMAPHDGPVEEAVAFLMEREGLTMRVKEEDVEAHKRMGWKIKE